MISQFVAVIFSDPARASEGARALSALHAEGGIAPSGMAVVVKEPSGQWLVKEKSADGAAGGALVGHGADLIHRKAATAFVDQVLRQLPPGQAALVTEITEGGTPAFTERMQAMGGLVVHG